MPTVRIYHRRESPTQTPEVAKRQEESLEIWGTPPRNIYQSDRPKVQADEGSLPTDARGIEFTTDIDQIPNTPPQQASWSDLQKGIIVEGEYAKLKVVTIVNRQK